MKRLLAFTIMLVLAIVIPATVLAGDAEYKNASPWCTANDDLGSSSHGQCVKFVIACYASGSTGALYACGDLLANNPKGFYDEYNNLDECVSHLRHGFVDSN
jgi:hypothetical protein